MISPYPKIILHECNQLSHPSMPPFYNFLEGFFWDVIQVCRYSSFDDFHAFKTDRLDDFLQLDEKASHGTRSGELGGSCSSLAIFFYTWNSRMFRSSLTVALSCWNSYNLFHHNSCLFSCTERSIRQRISLMIRFLIFCPCGINSPKTCPTHWRTWLRLLWLFTLTFLFSSVLVTSEIDTDFNGV